MAILISFDIDGTLEVGDPPGPLTMAMVKIVQDKGFLIGSCSDRPPSSQRSMWEEHHISVDFTVAKGRDPRDQVGWLSKVKSKFPADKYYHIGDREDLDHQYALQNGFEFLWPDEAVAKPWFLPDD